MFAQKCAIRGAKGTLPQAVSARGDRKHAGVLCCQIFSLVKIPVIYQFLNVGSVIKENVQAKQNRSLGQI